MIRGASIFDEPTADPADQSGRGRAKFAAISRANI